MNGDEILDVLKQIRDEAKETNARLNETNTRLESLEGRVDQTNTRLESLEGGIEQSNTRLESLEGRTEFLERRLTKGFESVVEQLESVARRQAESEIRLATEVTSLADVTRQVRDLFERKLDDHAMVVNHEDRIRALEDRPEK